MLLVGASSRVPRVQANLQAAVPGVPLRMDIAPEEAAVLGAAVQAEALVGHRVSTGAACSATTEVPATPRDICLGCGPGRDTVLLAPAGTALPLDIAFEIGLQEAGQASALIELYEGPPGPPGAAQLVAAEKLDGIEQVPTGHASSHPSHSPDTPRPSSRTNRTRLVPPPVLTGHASSLLPY